MDKAIELEPKLIEKEIRPQKIVEVLDDGNVRDKADINSMKNIHLKKGDSIVLDFGDHQVGYVSIKLKTVGSPQDAPVYLRLKFGEIAKEIIESSQDYDGWISRGWIQEEFIHLDVLPTTINLPRLGIEHGIIKNNTTDLDGFFKDLDDKIYLVIDQLLERMQVQGNKKVKNFPFLMGQGIWRGSDKLSYDDKLQDVIKQGTLTVGFIGLAECLVALIGKHHGESKEAQKLGLKIIGHMRQRMDEACEKYKLNFSLIATPAEGLSGRFTKIDKKIYGKLKGITDKEYYTNSFHVPVYYNISAYDKIKIEAPYHELTNGGHITYVELDGDTSNNLEAFETIIRAMKELGIGYGSINHPVDRDPMCGYSGVIEGDICPKCGRNENDSNIKFDRIRRITGYLVGTVDRFNDAKKAEVRDRVKHNK